MTNTSRVAFIWSALQGQAAGRQTAVSVMGGTRALVLLAVAHLDDRTHRPAEVPDVARLCGLGPQQARRHLEALTRSGWLNSEDRPSRYTLNT